MPHLYGHICVDHQTRIQLRSQAIFSCNWSCSSWGIRVISIYPHCLLMVVCLFGMDKNRSRIAIWWSTHALPIYTALLIPVTNGLLMLHMHISRWAHCQRQFAFLRLSLKTTYFWGNVHWNHLAILKCHLTCFLPLVCSMMVSPTITTLHISSIL